jgi:anti-sigma factor RsiW
MNCRESGNLLHAYLDGELDLTGTLAFERHLEDCADCALAYRNQQALRSAIRANAPYFKAPTRLRRSLTPSPTVSWAPLAAIAAALLLAIAGTWFVQRARPGRDLIAQEVVSGHVRSLMANHLVDVPSSDRHTVKPWFLGKLDFSPDVKDLTTEGFPRIGGRVDYIDGKTAAALIYQRGKHTINLFVWRSAGASEGREALQGYNVAHWSNAGLAYWAVSDLNANDLELFCKLARYR